MREALGSKPSTEKGDGRTERERRKEGGKGERKQKIKSLKPTVRQIYVNLSLCSCSRKQISKSPLYFTIKFYSILSKRNYLCIFILPEGTILITNNLIFLFTF